MNNILKSTDSEEGKFIQYSAYLQLDLSLIFWGLAVWSQSFLQYIFIIIDCFLVVTCAKETMKYSDEYRVNHNKLVKIAVSSVLVYIVIMLLMQSFDWICIGLLVVAFAYGLKRLSTIIAHSKSDNAETKFINNHFKTLRQYTKHKQAEQSNNSNNHK